MPNRPDEHDHDDDLGGGAELHPDVVSAADELSPPVVATESDLPDPADTPEGAEVTVLSDPDGNTSVYKVVDN